MTKVYADEESYNSGHGHAYKALGIDRQQGALVVVRPDHCELKPQSGYYSDADYSIDVAKIAALEDVASIGQFFDGFLFPVGER